ncbi:MAG: hypothetical protein ACYC0C_10590 [Devosia sp.]
MTLAIAHVFKNQIVILSDTKITPPGGGGSITEGMLKTTFLAPTIAVAFSGDPTLAKRALLSCKETLGTNPGFRDTITFFEGNSAGTQQEYLLAFAGPCRLFKIADGQSTEHHSRAWIGDIEGFEAFQSTQEPSTGAVEDLWEMDSVGPLEANGAEVSRLAARFRETLQHRNAMSVGHFCSVAASLGGSFRFLVVTTTFASPSEDFDNLGRMVLRPRGDDVHYRLVSMPPKRNGIAGLIFSFTGAKLAYVFDGPDGAFADRCSVVRFEGEGDLMKQAFEISGIEFQFADMKMV